MLSATPPLRRKSRSCLLIGAEAIKQPRKPTRLRGQLTPRGRLPTHEELPRFGDG